MEYYEDYLAHHGIKGQKWGVRRFQNPDGTRTALGKKRERSKNVDHDEVVKSTNPKELYKNRNQLSDKELQDRLNRVRNEQALEQMAKAKTIEGKRMAKQIIIDSGKEALKEAAKGAARGAVAAGSAWVAANGAKILVTGALMIALKGPIKG